MSDYGSEYLCHVLVHFFTLLPVSWLCNARFSMYTPVSTSMHLVAPRTLHSALDVIDCVMTTIFLSSEWPQSSWHGAVSRHEDTGTPCRGALSALVARQYFEHTDVVHERLAGP